MNTREGAAALQPHEARFLQNWTPSGNSVKIRSGYSSFSTGAGGTGVETLAVWEGEASSKLIGCGAGEVYDVSGSSASVLTSSASYSEDRWQTEVYKGYLLGVNATDAPWKYDGTAIAATGFTGVALADLANIRKVRNRLWTCLKDSATAYYAGIGSISGALTSFDLGQVVGGGYLMAVGAHSQDAGDGPDDYTVFIMSTGEIAIYAGDPSTTFTKVGNYKMPRPIGRDCLVELGGQLAIITEGGLIPIAAAVAGQAFDALALGNYGKVQPSLDDDADTYGANAGWLSRMWRGFVVMNVPLTTSASRQWVYNTKTGAWTQWTYPAASFAEWNGDLYFGDWSAGTVWKVAGNTDNALAIATKAECAFVSPGMGQKVAVTAIRFDTKIDGALDGSYAIDADFLAQSGGYIPDVAIAAVTVSTPWGSSWGSPWSSANQAKGQWFSTFARGRAVALNFSASTTASVEWYGAHLLVKKSGNI